MKLHQSVKKVIEVIVSSLKDRIKVDNSSHKKAKNILKNK